MSRPLRCLLLLALPACVGGGTDKGAQDSSGLDEDTAPETDTDTDADTDTDTETDTDTDTDVETDTDTDTDVEPEPITATLRGSITVETYTEDAWGRNPVDESVFFGGTFPYGGLFVAATTEDADGVTYVGDDAIRAPAFTGNTYELTVTLAEPGSVAVSATLDEEGNRIIQTTDPIGVHPDRVDITDGAVIEDVDITVLVKVPLGWDGGGEGGGSGGGSGSGGGTGGDGGGEGGGTGGGGGSGGGSGSGGGGGSGGSGGSGTCDLSISGELSVIDATWTAGTEAVAMLVTTDGAGPTDWAWVEPTATADGAAGDYALDTCPTQGFMNLVGASDSNANGLIDPSDTWGAYVTAPDTDGNPVAIDASDLTEHDIQVPLGEGESPLSIVPFVTISGEVGVGGGTFDDLPAGSSVVVAALRYRPTGALSTASLESDAYDHVTMTWPDLTGTSSFTYSLGVPAGTLVYLWAYADEDVDNLVNESGEAVASGGDDDNGRLQLGTSDVTQNLSIGYAGSR